MSYTSFSSVYDELTNNVDYSSLADYICRILENNGINDGLLLDLACGTGSLSLELSKKGFEVIGTDASENMLCEAQGKAFKENRNIMFLCHKMQETDLYGTVRAVVCTLDSINHLTSYNDVYNLFLRLKNFVDYGGIMIFDVNTVYKHRKVLGNNTFVYDEKNVFCVWQNHLYDDNLTVGITLDFFIKNGSSYKRKTESFKEKAYTPEELEKAVTENGFSILNIYNEDSFDNLKDTDERAVYVIKRNED